MNGGTYKDYSGTVGTSAQQAAPANTPALNYSWAMLQNQHGTNLLYYTVDGSTPVAGAPGTYELGPSSATSAGQGIIFVIYPNAGVKVIGSASATPYSCSAV